MSRLDRAVIAAIWKGHLRFDANPTFSPRFAHIGDLKFVRPMTGGWALIFGGGLPSIPLSLLAHSCIELCRVYHKPQKTEAPL